MENMTDIKTNIKNINGINSIEKLINLNINYRFTQELSKTLDAERISDLTKIINIINKNNEKTTNTSEMNKNRLSSFLDKLTDSKFKKPWTRLTEEQKIKKLEDYINVKYSNNLNKINIINLAKKFILEGKFKSSKEIDYDQQKCNIINITCKEFEKKLII